MMGVAIYAQGVLQHSKMPRVRVHPTTAAANTTARQRGRCWGSCFMITALLPTGVVALGEALFTLWMLIATDGDYGRVIRTYRVIVIGSFVIDGLSLFLVILGVCIALTTINPAIALYTAFVVAIGSAHCIVMSYIVNRYASYINTEECILNAADVPTNAVWKQLLIVLGCSQSDDRSSNDNGSSMCSAGQADCALSVITTVMIGASASQLALWICVLLLLVIFKVRYQKFTHRSWSPSASSPVDTRSDDSSRTEFTELSSSSSISLIDIRPTAPQPPHRATMHINCHVANKQPTAVKSNNFVFPRAHFKARGGQH